MERAMPTPKKQKTKALPDDVQILRQTYSLAQLTYVDITEQELLTQMMSRWPLLAELAHLNQDD
jgi:hypothetical protein